MLTVGTLHKKCATFKVGKSNNDITWTCLSCKSYLDSFPFTQIDVLNLTNNSISESLSDSSSEISDPLAEFSSNFFENLKLGHLNINSLVVASSLMLTTFLLLTCLIFL